MISSYTLVLFPDPEGPVINLSLLTLNSPVRIFIAVGNRQAPPDDILYHLYMCKKVHTLKQKPRKNEKSSAVLYSY